MLNCITKLQKTKYPLATKLSSLKLELIFCPDKDISIKQEVPNQKIITIPVFNKMHRYHNFQMVLLLIKNKIALDNLMKLIFFIEKVKKKYKKNLISCIFKILFFLISGRCLLLQIFRFFYKKKITPLDKKAICKFRNLRLFLNIDIIMTIWLLFVQKLYAFTFSSLPIRGRSPFIFLQSNFSACVSHLNICISQ